MRTLILILILAVGVLVALMGVVTSGKDLRLPGNDQGYRPMQPIAYSHRVHAGELDIPCLYCHGAAERSRIAGVPPAGTCMNCHQSVTASLADVREEERRAAAEKREPRLLISPGLAPLYEALGLDQRLRPDPSRAPRPVTWVRVHSLPDFVAFDHRPHVAAGVACQRCHGPVESMDRVQQFADLSMGWCVDCHRQAAATEDAGDPVGPLLDCATCHY